MPFSHRTIRELNPSTPSLEEQFPLPSVPTEQSIDRCSNAHKLNDYPICNHKVSIDPNGVHNM